MQLRSTHEDPTPIPVVAELGPLVAPTGAAPSYEQVETPKTPQRVPRSPVPRVPAKSPIPKVPAKPPKSPVKSQTHVHVQGDPPNALLISMNVSLDLYLICCFQMFGKH